METTTVQGRPVQTEGFIPFGQIQIGDAIISRGPEGFPEMDRVVVVRDRWEFNGDTVEFTCSDGCEWSGSPTRGRIERVVFGGCPA